MRLASVLPAGLFFLGLFLGGCARHVGLPKPSGTILGADAAKPIVASLQSCGTGVRTLRSLARVMLRHGQEKAAFRYATVFERPGKLRIEALPTNAAYTLSLLVIADGKLTYLDPVEKTAVQGEASRAQLSKFIGVAVEPGDLMSLLIGCLPERLLREEASIYASEGSTQVLGKQFYAEVDSDSRMLRRLVFSDTLNDLEAFEVKFAEHEDVEGIPVPGTLELAVPKHALVIELTQVSAKVNSEVRPDLFQASIPPEYK